MFLCAGVQASSIISTDGNTSFQPDNGSLPADQFIAAIGNDSYISYNEFSDFVVDQPLQIFNLPSGDTPAADLVIILAENLSISSSIEVVGPRTDLLILEIMSPDVGGNFTCANCSFYNQNRITMGAITEAESAAFSVSLLGVGNISSVSKSEALVSNLYAPSALSLEIVTEQMSLTGNIDLNQKASYEVGGQYENDLNGDKLVGTGSVNIYLGGYIWNYEEREIIGVTSGRSSSLAGSINAPNVRILSSASLTVSTEISTKTDLLATTMYRGELTIVDENIVLETVFSELTITGNIQSEGNIDLRSVRDLTIGVDAELEANEIKIIAGDDWFNYGKLDSNYVYAAAGSVENEGQVLAIDTVEIYADRPGYYNPGHIYNQYGAKIQSKNIHLESVAGVVRNGSKAPYRVDNYNSNKFYSGYEENLLAANNFGAFYQFNIDTADTSYDSVPDSSASILGSNIKIKGIGFENINPYYVIAEDGTAEIEVSKAIQTKVSAEDLLAIESASYILNSSALLQVNGDQGLLSLNAILLHNERYRVETHLSYYQENGDPITDATYNYTSTDSLETLSSEVVAYSLPGTIVSLGDMEVTAGQSVLNNTAYIEIFGDLKINSPVVNSLGHLLSSVEENSTSYVINQIFMGGYYDSTTKVIDSSQLDTLFFVDGSVLSNVDATFANHEPLDYFIDQAVDLIIEEDFAFLDTVRRCIANCGSLGIFGDPIYEQDSYTNGILDVGDEQVLQVSWLDQKHVSNNSHLCTPFCNPLSTEETGMSMYNLFDVLKRYFDSMVETFNNIYDEIKFW